MSTDGDLTNVNDGESVDSVIEQPDQPAHGSPNTTTEQHLERHGPHPVTVEDFPDEDAPAIAALLPKSAASTSATTAEDPSAIIQETRTPTEQNDTTAHTQKDSSVPAIVQLSDQEPEKPKDQEETPDVLKYLDADSPPVTSEAIQRTVSSSLEPVSPSFSNRSSVASSKVSDVFSHKTNASQSEDDWSPEQQSPTHFEKIDPSQPQHVPRPGPQVQHNGFYSQQSVPRFPQQGPWPQSPMTMHGTPMQFHAQPGAPQFFQHGINQPHPMPPAKPPVTGYQYIAMKLAGAFPNNFPTVTPIYRRFETLSHRFLLQLQDEIVELEQQLEDIDTQETHSRAHRLGGFVPASRRTERDVQDDLAMRKQRIFYEVGPRLSSYHQIVSQFKSVQNQTRPNHSEIQDYRMFLNHERPIAPMETRFLDDTNDLMSLVINNWDETQGDAHDRTADATPTPPTSSFFQIPADSKSKPVDETKKPAHGPQPQSPMYLVYAAIVAVLVPLVIFIVVPGFIERMVIVGLVFSGVGATVMQSGLLALLPEGRGVVDCVICAGLYGGLMAVLASTAA